MEKLKTFDQFIAENNTPSVEEQIQAVAFSCVYEAETGEVTVTVNEGFVQDLQLHIRKTLDILVKEHGIKANKLDKALEVGLSTLTSSFQKGDSPEETAAKLA